MAFKKKSTALARPQVTIVQAPRRQGRVRRAARKVGALAKRGGGALAKGAWEEKTAIAAVVGAGAVGYLDGAGHLDAVPDLIGGKVTTLAVAAYVGGRVMKSAKLRHAGIGLAAAAAFAAGQDHGAKSKKDK